MGLNELWFILIAISFTGFFFFESFIFGVGILMQWIGRNDDEKKMIIHSLKPVCGTNEGWLIIAGGVMLAAFPEGYAAMLGYYGALLLSLSALIIRGNTIGLRNRLNDYSWTKSRSIVLVITSLLIPFLLAIALASLLVGAPINAEKEYVGSFFDLLSLPALCFGLDLVVFFLYHGAIFLNLKLQEEMQDRAYIAAVRTGRLALVTALAIAITAALTTNIFTGLISNALTSVGMLALLLSFVCMRRRRIDLAFSLNGASIIAVTAALFTALFPRIMVSSIDKSFSLTIYNISSSLYATKNLTIVTLTLLSVVLLYTAWAYYVFRRRITGGPEHLPEGPGYAGETSV